VNECKHEIFFCGDCGTSLDDATTDLRRQLADKEAHYKALELFIEHLRQKPVYVVTMYRWGNRENHSYVAAVSLDADKARQMAEQEEIDRGGKYQAEVIEVPVDDTDGEKFIDILALKPHPAFSKGADRGVLRELESAEAREKAMVAALEEIRIIADKSMIADPILSEIYAIADDATNKQTCDNCGQPWKMCNGVKVGCVCKNWKERTEPDVENCENCAHEKSKKWCWSCGFKDGKPYSNWQAIDAALAPPAATPEPAAKQNCDNCGQPWEACNRAKPQTTCGNWKGRLDLRLVHLYNLGYHAGHHDTVEGQYVDIRECDMDTYHADVVAEIVADISLAACPECARLRGALESVIHYVRLGCNNCPSDCNNCGVERDYAKAKAALTATPATGAPFCCGQRMGRLRKPDDPKLYGYECGVCGKFVEPPKPATLSCRCGENLAAAIEAREKANPTMDIYSPKGAKVIFTGKGGYDHERERACKVLEIGKVYTVERTEVGSWHTSVWLKERPGEGFNSVHFAPAAAAQAGGGCDEKIYL
jgi:hypothetical protein